MYKYIVVVACMEGTSWELCA